jgi:hypothetical protein
VLKKQKSRELHDSRTQQHETQVDYNISLLYKLGYSPERKSLYFDGPDVRVGNIWIEVKSWDENKPSYSESKYWRRLVYTKIITKYQDNKGKVTKSGIITNTTEIPVKWRDHLRSLGIYPVYLDPKKSNKEHEKALTNALLQVKSKNTQGIVDNSLHSKLISFVLVKLYDLFPYHSMNTFIVYIEKFMILLLEIKLSTQKFRLNPSANYQSLTKSYTYIQTPQSKVGIKVTQLQGFEKNDG